MMDNGRKFVIIILLQNETRVATCGDTQAEHTRFAFLHENTRKSRLSCSWFVLYLAGVTGFCN